MNRRFLLLCIAVIGYQAADAMDERSAYPEKIVVWEGGIHFGWTRIILKPDGRIYGSAINRERTDEERWSGSISPDQARKFIDQALKVKLGPRRELSNLMDIGAAGLDIESRSGVEKINLDAFDPLVTGPFKTEIFGLPYSIKNKKTIYRGTPHEAAWNP